MEYKVIQHYNLHEFAQLVNKALANGWQPQGGVSISYQQSSSIKYAQALVKPLQR